MIEWLCRVPVLFSFFLLFKVIGWWMWLCCYSANLCEISKSSAILCEILSQLSFGKFFLLCDLPYKNLGNFGFRCILTWAYSCWEKVVSGGSSGAFASLGFLLNGLRGSWCLERLFPFLEFFLSYLMVSWSEEGRNTHLARSLPQGRCRDNKCFFTYLVVLFGIDCRLSYSKLRWFLTSKCATCY